MIGGKYNNLSQKYENKNDAKLVIKNFKEVINEVLKIYNNKKLLNTKIDWRDGMKQKVIGDNKETNQSYKKLENNIVNNKTLENYEKILKRFVDDKIEPEEQQTEKKFLIISKTKYAVPGEKINQGKILIIKMLQELYNTLKTTFEQDIKREIKILLDNNDISQIVDKYSEIEKIQKLHLKNFIKITDTTNLKNYGTKVRLLITDIKNTDDITQMLKKIQTFEQILDNIINDIKNEIKLINKLQENIKMNHLNSKKINSLKTNVHNEEKIILSFN